MKTRTYIGIVIFITCFLNCISGLPSKQSRHFFNSKPEDIMDVTDFSIYYDLETNQMIRKMMPRPWYKPGWMLRLPFRGSKCKCEGLHCECCTGVRIESINFDRSTCINLDFEPEDSLINMEVTMNNSTVLQNTYSARNPPPFCVPVPVPYLPPGLVDMCVRLFDIGLMMDKLHVCMDLDTRVDKAPVLVLHFDCMDMGLSGVSLSKPGGSGGSTSLTETSTNTTNKPTQLDSDVYDPVTEDPSFTTTPSMFSNSVKYI